MRLAYRVHHVSAGSRVREIPHLSHAKKSHSSQAVRTSDKTEFRLHRDHAHHRGNGAFPCGDKYSTWKRHQACQLAILNSLEPPRRNIMRNLAHQLDTSMPASASESSAAVPTSH